MKILNRTPDIGHSDKAWLQDHELVEAVSSLSAMLRAYIRRPSFRDGGAEASGEKCRPEPKADQRAHS
ncbi:hypothetical protein [Paractinoplanes hotanensis]|uniref:Abortive infection protein-like C-terminal domain-containing protein n=1 Tax=Paractinoplanes hotanensis TaxID=2906497 RepID=A0ABT0XY44_9ACTN|nr:hypothetical protein [Actinoplanes hotanensis]MCM4078711.1 hypothetical protein [Actinoplanes hotanensis]